MGPECPEEARSSYGDSAGIQQKLTQQTLPTLTTKLFPPDLTRTRVPEGTVRIYTYIGPRVPQRTGARGLLTSPARLEIILAFAATFLFRYIFVRRFYYSF